MYVMDQQKCWEELLPHEGALTAKLVRILDHHVRQLRHRMVEQVKVQWDNYSPHSATWEDAYDMRQQFPFLFDR
jgi:hypothetical protein